MICFIKSWESKSEDEKLDDWEQKRTIGERRKYSNKKIVNAVTKNSKYSNKNKKYSNKNRKYSNKNRKHSNKRREG